MAEKLPGFESEVCSRCGGSGSYSYCQMYGTTCFKCHGKKSVLTKRGMIAYQTYVEALKVPIAALKIGEQFLMEGVPGFTPAFWATVVEIRPGAELCKRMIEGVWVPVIGLEIVGEHPKHGRAHVSCPIGEERLVRKAQTQEYKRAEWLKALAFQATLTKAGTVRKREAVTNGA